MCQVGSVLPASNWRLPWHPVLNFCQQQFHPFAWKNVKLIKQLKSKEERGRGGGGEGEGGRGVGGDGGGGRGGVYVAVQVQNKRGSETVCSSHPSHTV